MPFRLRVLTIFSVGKFSGGRRGRQETDADARPGADAEWRADAGPGGAAAPGNPVPGGGVHGGESTAPARRDPAPAWAPDTAHRTDTAHRAGMALVRRTARRPLARLPPGSRIQDSPPPGRMTTAPALPDPRPTARRVPGRSLVTRSLPDPRPTAPRLPGRRRPAPMLRVPVLRLPARPVPAGRGLTRRGRTPLQPARPWLRTSGPGTFRARCAGGSACAGTAFRRAGSRLRDARLRAPWLRGARAYASRVLRGAARPAGTAVSWTGTGQRVPARRGGRAGCRVRRGSRYARPASQWVRARPWRLPASARRASRWIRAGGTR